jgi:glycogen(starch) synthase
MANDLRVLLTADAVGGVWNYATDLTRALAPQGVRFLVATMGPRPSAAEKQRVLATRGVELAESDFALEWMDHAGPASRCDASAWLASLARDFSPHLLHFNGYVHALVSWDAPVLVAAHSCVGTWWSAVHDCEPPAEWAAYRESVAAALTRASAVVAPSRALLDRLREQYGVNPRRASVIHNSTRLAPRQCAKQPFILAAGRVWDESKNLRILDEAAAHLPWPVLVAGSTECDGRTAPAFHHARLQGSLGRAEFAALLSSASVFAHPALYEPFGLAALEAARCGCALVLADIPSLRELWEGAALFVPPRNPAAWRSVLTGLAAEPDMRNDLATLARARARRYAAQSTARRYLHLYRELTS